MQATVRLIINYKRAQKTILRVNPQVPLKELLPAICEKCEFECQATVLLRDVLSADPLDLSKSLNDFSLREVYAKESKGASHSFICSLKHFTSLLTIKTDELISGSADFIWFLQSRALQIWILFPNPGLSLFNNC